MATITQTSAAPHFRAPAFFETVRTHVMRRRLYRKTLNELSQLSDYQLADLGLSRSTLHRVAWQAACKS